MAENGTTRRRRIVERDSRLGHDPIDGALVASINDIAHAMGKLTVAEYVEDEATVKRLRLRRGRVELHPENPAFSPLVLDSTTEIRILGRVVEVRRQLD